MNWREALSGLRGEAKRPMLVGVPVFPDTMQWHPYWEYCITAMTVDDPRDHATLA